MTDEHQIFGKKPVPYQDIFFISLTYLSKVIEDAFFEDFVFSGIGLVFFTFIIFMAYTLIKNSDLLMPAINNTGMFLIALFTASAYFIESFHPTPSYRDASRTLYMMLSIPLYAVWVYKDLRYVYYICLIFIGFSILNCLNVILNVSPVEALSVGDSNESRSIIMNSLYFTVNLNGIGYLAGTSALLCIILLKIKSHTTNSRIGYYILIALFLYAFVLSISRSAYLNFILLGLVYLYKSKYRIKPIQLIAIFGLIVAYIINNPETINNFFFSRFDEISFNEEETTDSRSLLYIKLIHHLDEVFIGGVGEGNYYGSWGLNSELARTSYDYGTGTFSYTVNPAHNSILQIIYYWGIFPVILYILYNFYMYFYLQKEKSSLYDIICYLFYFSTLNFIIFSNNFYNKDFSMIYGLVIGVYLNNKYKKQAREYIPDDKPILTGRL